MSDLAFKSLILAISFFMGWLAHMIYEAIEERREKKR